MTSAFLVKTGAPIVKVGEIILTIAGRISFKDVAGDISAKRNK